MNILINNMKNFIKLFFRIIGFQVTKYNNQKESRKLEIPDKNSMAAGIQRLKLKGFKPSGIIDLGAAEGLWSKQALKHFPESKYLLFEPLEERKDRLLKLSLENSNILPVHAAAGARIGTISFWVSDDLDGSGVYNTEKTGGNRTVNMLTVDEAVEVNSLKPPYLIKFDTHGFELSILEGAAKTLMQTEAIIMECYGFQIADKCLRFPDMCLHLEKLGFRLTDILNVVRRPADQMFWQCDAVFIKSDSAFFKKESYI